MSNQYLLDCISPSASCTMTPYTAPPATIDHYAIAPVWTIPIAAVIVLAVIIATAIVRYKANEEKGMTDRRRIDNPPKQCPTCGDKLETV